MCGIAGMAGRSKSAGLAAAVRQMVDALAHRGPDGLGVRDFGSCVLGNTRLAIVDLSERGHMPMCNEDETIWITYNGECYNAPELRSLLQSRGHRFKSTTDTEVIVHLYEEFGEDCADRLRGMFAFAIWDERQEKLLLARDRLGIKPLYVSHTMTEFSLPLKSKPSSPPTFSLGKSIPPEFARFFSSGTFLRPGPLLKAWCRSNQAMWPSGRTATSARGLIGVCLDPGRVLRHRWRRSLMPCEKFYSNRVASN